MELLDKLKAIMEQEFGITTDEQLIQAVEDMEPLDIGIFTVQMRGEKNAKTA